MTDLLPMPITGEAIDLTAPTDDLALWTDQLRELERQVKDVRDRIGEEIIRRLDKRGKWTAHAGRFTVTAPSPAPATEWDVDQLRATLADFVAQGLIDEEAVDDAVSATITWKVKPGGVKALAKISEEIAERLEACGQKVDKPRRVSVKVTR